MAESKHTPGPWEVHLISTHEDEIGCCFISGGDFGGLVGAAMPWPREIDSGDFRRVEANARLIAAAPDLLAVLTMIDAFWTEDFPGGPEGSRDWNGVGVLSDETIQIWRSTRAAIAKAEGRG